MRFFALFAVCVLFVTPTVVKAAPQPGDVIPVHVTVYMPTGNATRSGEMPYDGSAGCSKSIPMGSILQFQNGLVVRCNDTGLDDFMDPHIDAFCAYTLSHCIDIFPGTDDWHIPVPVKVLAWGS